MQHALVFHDWGVEGLVDAGAAPCTQPRRRTVKVEAEQTVFAREVGGAVVDGDLARGVCGNVAGDAAFPWGIAVGQVRQVPHANAAVFVGQHHVFRVNGQAHNGVPPCVRAALELLRGSG